MAILHKGCFQVTSWRQYPSAPNVAPVRDPCLAEPTSTNRVFWKVHLEGVLQGARLTVPTSLCIYRVGMLLAPVNCHESPPSFRRGSQQKPSIVIVSGKRGVPNKYVTHSYDDIWGWSVPGMLLSLMLHLRTNTLQILSWFSWKSVVRISRTLSEHHQNDTELNHGLPTCYTNNRRASWTQIY